MAGAGAWVGGAGAGAGAGGAGERGVGGATERGVEEVGPGVEKNNKDEISERKILIVGANEREVRGFIEALLRHKALFKLYSGSVKA